MMNSYIFMFKNYFTIDFGTYVYIYVYTLKPKA